jgi:IS4 transposase
MDSLVSEFDGIDLGDKRLDKRSKKLLDAMSSSPGRTIPQNFQTWAEIKSCYNFLSNPKTTPLKIFRPHRTKVLKRIQEHPIVLCLNDTTSMNYTSKVSMKEKGSIGKNIDGLWLHPIIAVTPERVNLGLINFNFYTRDLQEDKTHRNNLPIERKESIRWLNSYQKVDELAREYTKTNFVYIADREADIIELIDEALTSKLENESYADIIIRSKHDRLLDEFEMSSKEQFKIRKKLESMQALGEISFYLPATHDRKARHVTQELRSMTVVLKLHEKSKKQASTLSINVVMAKETLKSAKGEDPLTWILLTTLPVEDFENAYKIIEYYLCRWEIEIFFKVLKSGCKIEERQLDSILKMENLLVFFMIISWRIMYIIMLGRNCPEMSCDVIFEESEWKSVCKILDRKAEPPLVPPKLQEFIIMIASLGGYVTFKNSPPPGVTVMWRGMLRMHDFALAWQAFG